MAHTRRGKQRKSYNAIEKKLYIIQSKTNQVQFLSIPQAARNHARAIRGYKTKFYAFDDVGTEECNECTFSLNQRTWIKCDDVVGRCVAELEMYCNADTIVNLSIGKIYICSHKLSDKQSAMSLEKFLLMQNQYGYQFSTKLIDDVHPSQVDEWCEANDYMLKDSFTMTIVILENLHANENLKFILNHDSNETSLKQKKPRIASVTIMNPGISELEFRVTVNNKSIDVSKSSEYEALFARLCEMVNDQGYVSSKIDWGVMKGKWMMKTVMYHAEVMRSNGKHKLTTTKSTQTWRNKKSVEFSSISLKMSAMNTSLNDIRETINEVVIDGMNLMKHLATCTVKE